MEQSASSSSQVSASPQNSFACQSMTVHIYPTTGGHFEFRVSDSDNVDSLKKLIAEKINVSKDRICLLFRERLLVQGTLVENNLMDGCKLILLPSVETGLLRKKKSVPLKPVLNFSWLQVVTPEQSVMQALENLDDEEVSGFLAGTKPLSLQVRLGDHIMYIQLQLSTTTQNIAHRSLVNTSYPLTHATPNPSPLLFLPGLVPAAPSNGGTPTSPMVMVPPTPLDAPTTPTTPIFERSSGSPRLFEGDNREPMSEAGPSTATTSTVGSATFVEASRHLTQTLQHISSAALASRMQNQGAQKPGAVIDTMKHHGCGVYSGTFSGTLNPALQDKYGRPKRDVSTIIHILNDLLSAGPPANRRRRLELTGSSRRHQHDVQAHAKSQEEISRLSQENTATRGKMEQLQMMLQQRRARRQARREGSAPYPRPSSLSQHWAAENNNEKPGTKCQNNSKSILT